PTSSAAFSREYRITPQAYWGCQTSRAAGDWARVDPGSMTTIGSIAVDECPGETTYPNDESLSFFRGLLLRIDRGAGVRRHCSVPREHVVARGLDGDRRADVRALAHPALRVRDHSAALVEGCRGRSQRHVCGTARLLGYDLQSDG